MATVTDRHGNVIREEPDTLEDWKQAAQVEAGIRREFHAEIERLRATLRDAIVMIESIPRPSAGLVSNHVQAAWDKRVAAIHAALDEQKVSGE